MTRPNQGLLTGRRENLGTRLQRNNTNIDQDNIVTLSGNEYANQNLWNIRKQRVNQTLFFAYQHTTNILTFKHLNFKCAIWNYFWYQQLFLTVCQSESTVVSQFRSTLLVSSYMDVYGEAAQ